MKIKLDKILKQKNFRDKGLREFDGIDTAGIARIVGEISDADTNPAFPVGANVGDIYVITTVSGTVGGIEVEIGDFLTYSISGWFVLQANLIIDKDPTLSTNSDDKIPSQKAVKTFVETLLSNGIQLWQSGVDYEIGNQVLIPSTAKIYYCISNHTSGVEIELNKFKEISNGILYIGNVMDAGTIKSFEPTYIYVGETQTIYVYDESMIFGGLVDGKYVLNSGSTGYWVGMSGKYNYYSILKIPEFDLLKSYEVDDIVRYDNRLYICLMPIIGPSIKFDFMFWSEITNAVIPGNTMYIQGLPSRENQLFLLTDKNGIYKFEENSSYVADGVNYIQSFYDNDGIYTNPMLVLIGGGSGGVDEKNIIYVGKHGSDTNTGKNIGQAKLTFDGAISEIQSYVGPEALTPVNKYTIVCLDSGEYSGKTYSPGTYTLPNSNYGMQNGYDLDVLIVPEYISIYAPNAKYKGLLEIQGDTNITFDEVRMQDSYTPDFYSNINIARKNSIETGKTAIININKSFGRYGFMELSGDYSNNYSTHTQVNVKEIFVADRLGGFSSNNLFIFKDDSISFGDKLVMGKIGKITIPNSGTIMNPICVFDINRGEYYFDIEDVYTIDATGSNTIFFKGYNNLSIFIKSKKIRTSKIFELGDNMGMNNILFDLKTEGLSCPDGYVLNDNMGTDTSIVFNIDALSKKFDLYLKNINRTHPGDNNYKAVYVDKNTGEVYTEDEGSGSSGITEFECTVGTDILGNSIGADYNTLGAAIADGKTSILVIGYTSETGDIVFNRRNYYIKGGRGINLDFGTKYFTINMGSYNFNYNFIGTNVKIENLEINYNYDTIAKILFDTNIDSIENLLNIENCVVNNKSMQDNTYFIYTDKNGSKYFKTNIKNVKYILDNNISYSGINISGNVNIGNGGITGTTDLYNDIIENLEVIGKNDTNQNGFIDIRGCDVFNLKISTKITTLDTFLRIHNSNINGLYIDNSNPGLVKPKILFNNSNINDIRIYFELKIVDSGTNNINNLLLGVENIEIERFGSLTGLSNYNNVIQYSSIIGGNDYYTKRSINYEELDLGDKNTGVLDINFYNSFNQKIKVITGPVDLTFSNLTAGQIHQLKIENGGTNVTFPATIKWVGNTPPTLSTTGIDIINIYYDGVNMFGDYSIGF